MGTKLININQRSNTISPSQRISIITKIQQQSNKILSSKGDLTSITSYQELMVRLGQLHDIVSSHIINDTTTVSTWLWYSITTRRRSSMTKHYTCARQIPSCKQESAKINNQIINIKQSWSSIIRAGQQVRSVFNSSYWKTGDRSKKFAFGEGIKQIRQDAKNVAIFSKQAYTSTKKWFAQGKEFIWQVFNKENRTSWNTQRKANKVNKKQQKDLNKLIKDTKNAVIASNGQTVVNNTQWSSQINSLNPIYSQQMAVAMKSAINQTFTNNIKDQIRTQWELTLYNERGTQYALTEQNQQVYDLDIKTVNNIAIDQCQQHCSNIPWVCGNTIS